MTKELKQQIESIEKKTDQELKDFILMQLCLYGPSKLLLLAEQIVIQRS